MDHSYSPWTFYTIDDSYLGLFILDDLFHVGRLTKINTHKMDIRIKMCLRFMV